MNAKTFNCSQKYPCFFLKSTNKSPPFNKVNYVWNCQPSKSHTVRLNTWQRYKLQIINKIFILTKSATGAHQLLLEAHAEAAVSERSSHEWSDKFSNGDFNIEDKDFELKSLLHEDLCQTQEKLIFGVAPQPRTLGSLWTEVEEPSRSLPVFTSFRELRSLHQLWVGFLEQSKQIFPLTLIEEMRVKF